MTEEKEEKAMRALAGLAHCMPTAMGGLEAACGGCPYRKDGGEMCDGESVELPAVLVKDLRDALLGVI